MEIIKNEFLHKTTVPLLVTRHEKKKRNDLSNHSHLNEPTGVRTRDTWIKSPVLYQLSYEPSLNKL